MTASSRQLFLHYAKSTLNFSSTSEIHIVTYYREGGKRERESTLMPHIQTDIEDSKGGCGNKEEIEINSS